jgi:CheY-like chemotaxis protein
MANDALSESDSQRVQTIFIVEDDADIGEFLVEALKQETPYQALLATDGFQALKMVRSLKPDLFVLDYLLPSMNGLELYERLQAEEELKHIPTLFISANFPTGELEKHRVYFLRKPFELEELLQTIREIIRESNSSLLKMMIPDEES